MWGRPGGGGCGRMAKGERGRDESGGGIRRGGLFERGGVVWCSGGVLCGPEAVTT